MRVASPSPLGCSHFFYFVNFSYGQFVAHFLNAGLDNIGKVETSIEQISIDRCLGITKAPDDFFGQFADETGKIVSAGLGNMKRGN